MIVSECTSCRTMFRGDRGEEECPGCLLDHMVLDETPEEWAARVAKSFTRKEWLRAEEYAKKPVGGRNWYVDLLAYRDKVAAGLGPRLRAQLGVLCGEFPNGTTSSALRIFCNEDLAVTEGYDAKPTDFGREIVRVLGKKSPTTKSSG